MMRIAMFVLAAIGLPSTALAADCASLGSRMAQPVQATVLAPVSAELSAPGYRLGRGGGVLADAWDEAYALDQVLLRMQMEGCAVAAAIPVAPVSADPNDPATYQPQTEFDNSPWRFDMSQNGRMMTADEFDEWMKARGVRVARGAPKPAAEELPAAPDGGGPEPDLPAPAADGAGEPTP